MKLLMDLWKELSGLVVAVRRLRVQFEGLAGGMESLAAGDAPAALDYEPDLVELPAPPANGRAKKRRTASTP